MDAEAPSARRTTEVAGDDCLDCGACAAAESAAKETEVRDETGEPGTGVSRAVELRGVVSVALDDGGWTISGVGCTGSACSTTAKLSSDAGTAWVSFVRSLGDCGGVRRSRAFSTILAGG